MSSARTLRRRPVKKGLSAGRVSLARALSKLGAATRKTARVLIAEGRVRVNGRHALDPDAWINLNSDVISIDHTRVVRREFRYLAFHKPTDVVTTRSDERGRRTVYDVLGAAGTDLRTVGRLDKDSTGLLLLTNDNRLADCLTDPRSRMPKVYLVKTSRPLSQQEVRQIERGMDIQLEGASYRTKPAAVRVVDEVTYEISLTEGKNRQVRRMVKALGADVLSLVRVSIGPVALGTLPVGSWRELEPSEMNALKQYCRSGAVLP